MTRGCNTEMEGLNSTLQIISPKWVNIPITLSTLESHVATGVLHVLFCIVPPEQLLPNNMEPLFVAVLMIILTVIQCGMKWSDKFLVAVYSILRLKPKYWTIAQCIWTYILSLVLCELIEKDIPLVWDTHRVIIAITCVCLLVQLLRRADPDMPVISSIEADGFTERAWAGPILGDLINMLIEGKEFIRTSKYTIPGLYKDYVAKRGGYNGDLAAYVWARWRCRQIFEVYIPDIPLNPSDGNEQSKLKDYKEKLYDAASSIEGPREESRSKDVALLTYLPHYATNRASHKKQLRHIVKRGEYLWTCIVIWVSIFSIGESLWTRRWLSTTSMIASTIFRVFLHCYYSYIPGPCGRVGLINVGERFTGAINIIDTLICAEKTVKKKRRRVSPHDPEEGVKTPPSASQSVEVVKKKWWRAPIDHHYPEKRVEETKKWITTVFSDDDCRLCIINYLDMDNTKRKEHFKMIINHGWKFGGPSGTNIILCLLAEATSLPATCVFSLIGLCRNVRKIDKELEEELKYIILALEKLLKDKDKLNSLRNGCSAVRKTKSDWLTAANKLPIIYGDNWTASKHELEKILQELLVLKKDSRRRRSVGHNCINNWCKIIGKSINGTVPYSFEMRDEFLGHWIKRIWEKIIENKEEAWQQSNNLLYVVAKSAMLFVGKYDEGVRSGEAHWLERDRTERDKYVQQFVNILQIEQNSNPPDDVINNLKRVDTDIAQRVSISTLSSIWEVYITLRDELEGDSKDVIAHVMTGVLYIEWLSICNRRQKVENDKPSEECRKFGGLVATLCRLEV